MKLSHDTQSSDAPVTTNLLEGAEVAITGRFASMSQSEVGDLIRDFGGRLVRSPSMRTRLLVIGEGGLPLGEDGKPTAQLEKAKQLISQGSGLEIVSEETFVRRLGLGHGPEQVSRRYTVVELSRLLKLPGARIRTWLKRGLIEPAETVNRIALFEFHQMAAIRSLCELIESGLAPTEIRKGLDQLKKLMPESETPLLHLSAMDSASKLVVRLENGQLAEPSGQLYLDFDEEPDDTPESLQFIAVARTTDELFDDGVALEFSGRFQEAAETYERAIGQDPKDPVLHFNLGNVLYRLGDAAAAASQFHQAVRLDPSYVEAWNNLGSMHFELGQIDESIQAFRRALSLAPSYSDACFNLATVLTQSSRDFEAAPLWQTYLSLDPSGASADVARRHLVKK